MYQRNPICKRVNFLTNEILIISEQICKYFDVVNKRRGKQLLEIHTPSKTIIEGIIFKYLWATIWDT